MPADLSPPPVVPCPSYSDLKAMSATERRALLAKAVNDLKGCSRIANPTPYAQLGDLRRRIDAFDGLNAAFRSLLTWREFQANPLGEQPLSLWGKGLLVPGGSYTLIFGETGIGKTTLGANLVFKLATGASTFLGFPLPGLPTPCAFIEREGEQLHVRTRLRQIALANSVDPDADLPIWFPEFPGDLSLEEPEGFAELLSCCASFGIKVVALGSIGKFFGGDEVDASVWRKFVSIPFEKWAVAHDLAFLINDHPNQSGDLRGTLAKRQDSGCTIRLSKGRGPEERCLEFQRVRDGGLPNPKRIGFQLDEELGLVKFAAGGLEDAGGEDKRVDPRIDHVRRIVADLTARDGVGVATAGEIHERLKSKLGIGQTTSEDLLRRAVEAGRVEQPKKGLYRPCGEATL
jgi:hypothetical protein